MSLHKSWISSWIFAGLRAWVFESYNVDILWAGDRVEYGASQSPWTWSLEGSSGTSRHSASSCKNLKFSENVDRICRLDYQEESLMFWFWIYILDSFIEVSSNNSWVSLKESAGLRFWLFGIFILRQTWSIMSVLALGAAISMNLGEGECFAPLLYLFWDR